MELSAAVINRHSIRGFLPRPVDQQVLREILRLGVRAVSARNIQPWEFSVVTGEVLERIREDNMDCFVRGLPGRDEYGPLEGVFRQRSIVIAKQLFSAMEIARDDKQGRREWLMRGYRFFDAPAAVIISMDASLDEKIYRFDLGCVTQNICLAAMEYGLGTCVEEQGIYYERGLRKYLRIPDDRRLEIAIAIGYPDPSFPANSVVTPREEVDDITQWYGYD